MAKSNCYRPEDITRSRRGKQSFDPKKLTDIERRVKKLSDRMWATRQKSASTQQARSQSKMSFEHKLQKALNMTAAHALNPKQSAKTFQHWLAKNHAVWKKKGQMGFNATPSGMVRQYMKRSARLFGNDLADTIGRLGIEERIRANWDTMVETKKAHKISDEDFYELSTSAVELSYARYAPHYYKAGPAGLKFLQGKFTDFHKFMNRLGLDAKEQDAILKMGKEVADSYHQVLKAAQDKGINVQQLENMEFFPRQMSKEIQKRFEFERFDEAGNMLPDRPGETNIGQAFMKSRNTHNYIIEDDLVLDAFLTANKAYDHMPPNINNVNDLMDPSNGRLMLEALDSLDDEKLEILTESGILSKIPFTSIEYRDWVASKFPLPSKNLNTLMTADWTRAFTQYRQQLKNAAAQSGQTWSLIRNATGADGNTIPWGVTKAEVRNDPVKYKNFRPLFPDNSGRESVLTSDQIKAFVDSKRNPADKVPNTYVHPIAADMYRSMTDISTDPGLLGMIANNVSRFYSVFKSMAVSTGSFMTNQFLGTQIQMWSAGGNFFNYMPAVAKNMQMLFNVTFGNKSMFEATNEIFDNKDAIYKGLGGKRVTEAEFYRQNRKLNFTNDYVPAIGQTMGAETAQHSFSPYNIKGLIQQIDANFQQMGLQKGVWHSTKDVLETSKRAMVDPITSKFGWAANELENAARFQTMKTLMYDRNLGSGFHGKLDAYRQASAQFAASQKTLQFDDLESGVEHAQNYFFMFDDQGRHDALIRDLVVPFWSYVSRNPVSQLRAASRQPVKYGNMLRAYSALNGREEVENELADDEGTVPLNQIMPEHLRNQRPIFWTLPYGNEGEDGEERPLVYYFPSRNFNPVYDGIDTVASATDTILRLTTPLDKEDLGRAEPGYEKTDKQNVEHLETDTNTLVDKALANTYGPFKAAAGSALGREIGTGRERTLKPDKSGRYPTSILGIKVPPVARYLLEESIPLLQRFNDMNPGNIFGTRRGYKISEDGSEIEVVEGEESIFGAPRSDFDKETYYRDMAKRIDTKVQSALFRVDFFDPMFKMADNISDVRRNISSMEQEIRKQKEAIEGETNPDQKQKLIEELDQMVTTVTEMRVSLRRLERWADDKGLQPQEAYEQMLRRDANPPPLDREERLETRQKTVRDVLENSSSEARKRLNQGSN